MTNSSLNPNRSLDFMVDFVLLSGRLISVFVEDVAGYMDFVLLSGRLISVFVEDVAGYIEKKQEARCRQQYGKRLKSQLKFTVDSLTLFGGLMTVLG